MTDILHNAFLDDLNDDFVAINANGVPIGRAGTREALERAHADLAVTILSASEALAAQPTLAEAATASLDGPFAAIVAQGVEAQPGTPETDADPANPNVEPPKADPFDHDGDGVSGGSKKGAESTATKGAEAKKAAAHAKTATAKK